MFGSIGPRSVRGSDRGDRYSFLIETVHTHQKNNMLGYEKEYIRNIKPRLLVRHGVSVISP